MSGNQIGEGFVKSRERNCI